jgi:hypothetical protein
MLAALRTFFALSLVLLAIAGVSACDSGDEETGSLVVGVTSDYTDLAELEVTTTVDGEVLTDERTPIGGGGTTFPAEFAFEDVTEGQALAITLRGYDSTGFMRVVRHMETTAVAGSRNLVRVNLDAGCRLEPVGGNAPSGAPECNETSQTCIGGACQSANVSAGEQQAYESGWAGGGNDDVCKPANAGPPELEVGSGQSDFFSIPDYEVVQVEAGPQGGHHVWVSARLRNLHQSGSIIETGAEIPALGLTITPLKVIFTFDQDEGGYCKIFGLRLQLDIDGDAVEPMLGQEVKVIMTITDSDDDVGVGEKWVTLSSDII